MGVENSKIKLGQNVEGASYAYDLLGNVIGWYDYDEKRLYISEKYKNKKQLADQIYEHSIKYSIIPDLDSEMLEFFERFHKERMKKIKKHKEMIAKHEERVKLIPKRHKKVKNAEQKIKKRHD